MNSSAVALLARAERIANRLLRWLAMFLLLVLCVIMALQVFQRFVIGRSLDWPDELAPTLLAWISFVGAALAARDDEHVGFSLLLEIVPARVALAMRVAGTLVVVGLLSVYVAFSFPLMSRTWDQMLTTIDLSRGALYAVLPATALIMIGYVLRASPFGRWLRGPSTEPIRSLDEVPE